MTPTTPRFDEDDSLICTVPLERGPVMVPARALGDLVAQYEARIAELKGVVEYLLAAQKSPQSG